MKEAARKSRKFNQRDFENPVCLLTFQLIQWLDTIGDDARDLHKAIGKLSPFFYPEFLESKEVKKLFLKMLICLGMLLKRQGTKMP